MMRANVNRQTAVNAELTCCGCGEMYNYVFLSSVTLAFCPFATSDKLDETIDQIRKEHRQGRIHANCQHY